jgi:hypothetical protein
MMNKHLIFSLVALAVIAPRTFSQSSTAGSTPVPEEARRHFVMGTALFAEAKKAADFVEVESEFKLAAQLAPQWPDPRYNLALTEEAAGDFADAMADLKLYMQFKLSDADARKAQDKIYVLEAKQRKALEEANAEAEANKPAAQFARFVESLQGKIWRCRELQGGYIEITFSGATMNMVEIITQTQSNMRAGDRIDYMKATLDGNTFSSPSSPYGSGPAKGVISSDGETITVTYTHTSDGNYVQTYRREAR